MKTVLGKKKNELPGKRNRSGFTLVELIVTLVILAVISAIAVPAFLGFIDKGKAKECEAQLKALAADVASMKMAAEMDGEVKIEGETGGTEKTFGEAEINEYLESLGEKAQCPVDGQRYVYKDNKITCPSNHGDVDIPSGEKVTVKLTEPSPEPSAKPTATPVPTAMPTPEPTATPTETPEPTATPTSTATPTATPAGEPTAEPTATPTPTTETGSTENPTPEPTAEPTPEPTAEPEEKPTPVPTAEPVTPPKPEQNKDISLNITPNPLHLSVGKSGWIRAYSISSDCIPKSYEWSIDNTAIAEIDGSANGVNVQVQGKMSGECTITCTLHYEYKDDDGNMQEGVLSENAVVYVGTGDSKLLKGVSSPFLVDVQSHNVDLLSFEKIPGGTWTADPSTWHINTSKQDNGTNGQASLVLDENHTGNILLTYTVMVDGVEQSETIYAKAVQPAISLDQPRAMYRDGQVNNNREFTLLEEGRISINVQHPETTDKPSLAFINWNPNIIHIGEVQWEGGTAYANIDTIGVGTAKVTASIYCEYEAKFINCDFDITVKPAIPTKIHLEPSEVELYLNDPKPVDVNLVIDEPKGAAEYAIESVTWENTGDQNAYSISEQTKESCKVSVKEWNQTRGTLKVVVKGPAGNSIEAFATVKVMEKPLIFELQLKNGEQVSLKANEWADFQSLVTEYNLYSWENMSGKTQLYFDEKGNVYALKKYIKDPGQTTVYNDSLSIEVFISKHTNWQDYLVPVNTGSPKQLGDDGITVGDIVTFTDSSNIVHYYVVTENVNEVLTQENIGKYAGEVQVAN